jgi:hypothetical protein
MIPIIHPFSDKAKTPAFTIRLPQTRGKFGFVLEIFRYDHVGPVSFQMNVITTQ